MYKRQNERTPLELLFGGDVDRAAAQYRELLDSNPQATAASENRLNQLGYDYLNRSRAADAVAIFRLNATLYPESSNVYDSLGEALMKNGRLDEALDNYGKSLDLDPANSNAEAMIEQIRRTQSSG